MFWFYVMFAIFPLWNSEGSPAMQEESNWVLAFGSCNKQDLPQTYWSSIAQMNPDLWLWLGDIVYADTEDTGELSAAYRQLSEQENYLEFRQNYPILGTWDDHDYGKNDGGKEWSIKEASKHIFCRFMGFPANHEIYNHEGIYYSTTLLRPDLPVVKIISLDTRTFRDSLPIGTMGNRYDPNEGGDILGEEQWMWLEMECKDSIADLIIILSSIQVIPHQQAFEKWANFPAARNRILNMLQSIQGPAFLILSGDRHIAEVSLISEGFHPPLYEITSSGLTHTWNKKREEPNEHRVGDLWIEKNFGIVNIGWHGADSIKVNYNLRKAEDGSVLQSGTYSFTRN